ncbi:SPOR domain-containing protein [Hydrocarboniphaga effusa]|jgi:DedD protein|uniref:SPOR domain-containing protein n=2 Tax=Hydrocarboniphaga effusa TaxID=243629 RepID=UPI003137F209
MNETLIRRLVGAGVLAAGALIVSLLLPQPNQPPELEAGLKVVEVQVDESGRMVEQFSDERPLADGRDRSREDKGRPALSAGTDERRYVPDSVELAASGETDIRPPTESGSEPAVAEQAPEMEELPEEPVPESRPKPAGPAPASKPAEKPATKPTEKPAPNPQTKPAEPPRKTDAPKPAVPAPIKDAPKPTPVPATPKPEAATVAKPDATPPPSPKPEATATAPKPVTPAAPGAVRWAVQAGSYADIANARQIQAQLKSLGYPSNITVIDTSGGARYRVRCGPFPTREAADAARGRIAGSKLPAQVVNDGP